MQMGGERLRGSVALPRTLALAVKAPDLYTAQYTACTLSERHVNEHSKLPHLSDADTADFAGSRAFAAPAAKPQCKVLYRRARSP